MPSLQAPTSHILTPSSVLSRSSYLYDWDTEFKMMSWTRVSLLALLAVLFALSLSPEADSAAVPSSTGSVKDPQGPLKRIFMNEADATNFFRRRTRRGAKSQDEINAEQRQVLAADERKREFHEEKRNEFESYAEEENDEQNERTRESTEQWREFHYDGMHPPYEYNRHTI
ncbi:putative cartilage matrix-associated protein [Sphaeramia orbicularis]|uniref:putative cartilage matrix-associated protein n=1 Tax=Sphaeramia orbicularis TaxID=375764 RepID=UPI001180893A|nr:unique cartilage matrix-associated protein-like [Sphaeramia orbicularis]